MIYKQRLHSWVGIKLRAAWGHIFANMTARLPIFSRAVDGWKLLVVAGERFGMCNERYAAAGRFLFSQVVTAADWQAAMWWVLQRDTYAREQDLEQLRHSPEDVAIAERKGIFFALRSFSASTAAASVTAPRSF